MINEMTRAELENALVSLEALHNATNQAVIYLERQLKNKESQLINVETKLQALTAQMIIKDSIFEQRIADVNRQNNMYLQTLTSLGG